MRNTKGTLPSVRIKRLSALRNLSEKKKRHGHMFIDVKTKADIFTIRKGCLISKFPNSNKIVLKKP